MDHLTVDRRDSDVLCPKCKAKMIKTDYPLRAMPNPPANGEFTTTAMGLAYCPDCGGDVHSWDYRTTVADDS